MCCALCRAAWPCAGVVIAVIAYVRTAGRAVGRRNLELAFPEMPTSQRAAVLREEYRHLGWLLAEFCQMFTYTRETASLSSARGLGPLPGGARPRQSVSCSPATWARGSCRASTTRCGLPDGMVIPRRTTRW